MKLEDYLYENRILLQDFAEIIDFHRSHISSIIHGRLKPSGKFIRAVERATDGKVTEHDFINIVPKVTRKVKKDD